ncbi:bL27 family ribosomal protein [Candidatus Parcubacteria bacterium]|nr:bL27 family ribosomal protein [Patescibacteria group bacterium]MBU4380777.1 bL27 family ribosomal protein [Patescibacteria group bacterium]MCG2688859.1 bL27 family ribosomal protein [Candidatus Parcubacteria bacterium]
MAHKKAGGSKARQGGNVAGKRLGVKVYGDQAIKCGGIVVRQRGSTHKPGKNAGMGRDFTIFAKKSGLVSFRKKGAKSFVDIV